MITNYYTLSALVREWAPDLTGCVVGDAYSQARDELTLALGDAAGNEWSVRVSIRPPFRYVFRGEGYSRARRNVVTLFHPAIGRQITGLRMADRDRIVYLDLDDSSSLQILPFGSKANILWVDEFGMVQESFQKSREWVGLPAPEPAPAPPVDSFETFKRRWPAARPTVEQAIATAFPLFDRTLAAEVFYRSDLPAQKPAAYTLEELSRLYDEATSIERELKAPVPRVYVSGRFVDQFSLIELRHRAGDSHKSFDTVDEAVRFFVRNVLHAERFRAVYGPLEKTLSDAERHNREKADRMLQELSRESRADRYERWGHLLTASLTTLPERAEQAVVPDLFDEGKPVTIPLDGSLPPVENAKRYYDKARQTRQAREYAEHRMLEAERTAGEARSLLERLQALHRAADVELFRKEESERLKSFGVSEADRENAVPFRRYRLTDEYEVWVGKNAKQNDLLTFKHARKDDLWLHARGYAGSHAVLRLPHRNARPGKPVIEQAASIAAWYSKGQGSDLVPVIVVPRKYVRKPRGTHPGAVLVEREQVVLVPPKLPGK